MNIVLYIADREICETNRSIIKNFLISNCHSAKIFSFFSNTSVLNKLSETPDEIDILIFDTGCADKNSCAYNALRLFRKSNTHAEILLKAQSYSTLNDWLLLHPIAYFIDSIATNSLCQCLNNIFSAKSGLHNEKNFTIRTRFGIEKIPYSKIDYFESNQRNVILHLTDREQTPIFLSKLDDIETQLCDERFIRSHQSYLVNSQNVEKIDRDQKQFVFESGKRADISKRRLSHIMKAFEETTL